MTFKERFLAEGFPADILEPISSATPFITFSMGESDERLTPLDDGDIITIGDMHLETVVTPGHTPGNAMFWLKEKGIMFTGDQVLFDITPNITTWAGIDDSLGDYLESLERIKQYPVKLALPGHRTSGDYHLRIDELIHHHKLRVTEILDILHKEQHLNAYELTSRMSWNVRGGDWDHFPNTQKWYAVGECIAHLDYLRKENLIERINKTTIAEYRAIV